MNRNIIYSVIVIIVFFAAITCADGWLEDFESYALTHSDDLLAPAWENMVYDTGHTPPKIQLWVVDTEIGGNTSKKMSSLTWNYPWVKRPFGSQAYGNVTLTAQVALGGSTLHPSHPLADHIMLGNVALGIAGSKISYGVLVPGSFPFALTGTDFTKVGDNLLTSTWYDVKIVVQQIAGSNNDVANLYYKLSSDTQWTTVVTGLAMNADLDGFVYLIPRSTDYYGYIDNVELSYSGRSTNYVDLWSDDFESYAVNQSYWSGESQAGVPWYNISNPVQYGRIFKLGCRPADPGTATDWKIQDNESGILFGLGWNKVWYSRDIVGTDPNVIGATSTIEITAQLANYSHTGTAGHPSWPLGDHLVVGGVAIGIGGDDMTYQVLNANPPAVVIDNTTVTRVAPVLFKTWYDVKIVYKKIEGTNNDKADLYYKLASSQDWIAAASDLQLSQDLGSKVYLFVYGADQLGAVDNIAVKVMLPSAQNCGDSGTVYLPADINKDCYVDFEDISEMAAVWLGCTEPDQLNCL